jgi:hypothetical protein
VRKSLDTTNQTYQIYVGAGFNLATDLHGMRSLVNGLPTSISDVTVNSSLPTGWTSNYNDTTACEGFSSNDCGILQVTVDFSKLDDIKPVPANGLCKPQNFCSANGDSCGCALTKTDPRAVADPTANSGFLAQCQQACSVWAVKDLDYPPDGVYGFAFTLPKNFMPDDQGQAHRPTPTVFPTTAPSGISPNWLTQFVNTALAPDNASPGQCYYPKLPGASDCAVLP